MPPEPSENSGRRQYWKGSRYTVEERKIIEPYKDAFRSQESKAGRLQILKCDILPAIFNYWVSIERAPMDEEESRMHAKVNYQTCEEGTVLLITSPGTNNLAFQQLANDQRLLEEIKQLQGQALRSYLELIPGQSV